MNPKDTVGAKKAPLRYVPRALDIEVAAVMATGAAKYGPFNWREQPVSAVTYAEAMLRHIYAWMEGQDNAEDSGLSHIAHVGASAGILLDAVANGTLLDDRTKGPAADILRRLDQSTDAVKVQPFQTGDLTQITAMLAQQAKLLCKCVRPEVYGHAITCPLYT